MRTVAWWSRPAGALLVGAALAAGGCDEPAGKSSAKGPATGAPARPAEVSVALEAQPAGATQPQTSPADTQPANAYLTIDGHVTEFPPARLRLAKSEEGVTALLFSDDPKNATSADYRGNSFYFKLPLRISEVTDLDRAEYWYKADDSEPSESPDGIFLNGTKYHLQPQDVAVSFDADGKRVMAQVRGRFLVVRTSGAPVPGQMAAVVGTLYTTAESK